MNYNYVRYVSISLFRWWIDLAFIICIYNKKYRLLYYKVSFVTFFTYIHFSFCFSTNIFFACNTNIWLNIAVSTLAPFFVHSSIPCLMLAFSIAIVHSVKSYAHLQVHLLIQIKSLSSRSFPQSFLYKESMHLLQPNREYCGIHASSRSKFDTILTCHLLNCVYDKFCLIIKWYSFR